MIQNKQIKNVTSKIVTEIILESTDIIYQLENDALNIALGIMENVIDTQIKDTAKDLLQEFLQYGNNTLN